MVISLLLPNLTTGFPVQNASRGKPEILAQAPVHGFGFGRSPPFKNR
jgi:hypothetical protein